MPFIGLTGIFGSGKTTVLNFFKEKGLKVLSLDQRIHILYNNRRSLIYKKIKKIFPEAIDEKGQINRSKLGEIVFNNREKLDQLEKIVHPYIIKELQTLREKNSKKKEIWLIEVPLLFEKKLENLFDFIILVRAKKTAILNRLANRKKISLTEAKKRFRLFLPDRFKKGKVDFIINNNKNIGDLKREVDKLWEKLAKKIAL